MSSTVHPEHSIGHKAKQLDRFRQFGEVSPHLLGTWPQSWHYILLITVGLRSLAGSLRPSLSKSREWAFPGPHQAADADLP